MPPRDPVADYLDALSRALAFDPRLARRVRREVEDHLQDAIAAEADGPSIAARQRALARFGDCRALAEQYRALSLVASAQRMAASVIVAGGTIFLTMKLRVLWYALLHWSAGARLATATSLALPIDRYAFFVGALLGIAAWIHAAGSALAPRKRAGCGRRMRRSRLLAAGGTAGLSLAVALDLLLTALRLAEAPGLGPGLIPAVLMLVEIAVTFGLVLLLRTTLRRAAACEAS
ncbi:MAG TPA: permease prefix domain 1-containing protein [Stellaceae bacterium]|nr:permease prefix domain 1-containing protein [Stellaceae bacterium]